MPIKPILEAVEQLTEIHQQLQALSVQKMEAIKSNQMEQLQKLIVSEQKLVRSLSKTEEKRIQHVAIFVQQRQMKDSEIAISDILEEIPDDSEKQKLEQAAISLSEAVHHLREQEQLNRELLKQSLQFVDMSLEMLHPSLSSMNYGNRHAVTKNKSMFDSKA